LKLGPQELPALSDLFGPNLIGADQLEKGRSRNLQELAPFVGRENLVFSFHLELLSFSDLCDTKNRASVSLRKTRLVATLRSLFGNPADPLGPVAFRPTLTGGLALSETLFVSPLSESHAN
jgi:hypothetical protein